MNRRYVVFDVWSDYAHFKKYYTTSSPLTFLIPPRTAIAGLISAIIGLSKKNDEYLKYFTCDQANIAVAIVSNKQKEPLKKCRFGINTTADWIFPLKRRFSDPRKPATIELLKEPCFRIYLSHVDAKLEQLLINNLSLHKSYYTPYLGISEMIADFKYIGVFEFKELSNTDLISVSSAIPLSIIEHINITNGSNGKYHIFKELIPVEMRPGRTVTKYEEVIFEASGKPISVKVTTAHSLTNDTFITPIC